MLKQYYQTVVLAIMGSATASGPDRAKQAIMSALDSPLLK